MTLLLSLFLLLCLCTCSSWGVSFDTLVVKQTPDVSITVGKPVNISCCWNGEFDRGRINWTKNQITVKREHFSYSINTQGSQPKKTSDCSYLTFQYITRADSGRYICSLTVELPVLLRVEGDGTVITVTANKNRYENTNAKKHNAIVEESQSEEVWVHLLRCLPLLTLIISLSCIIKWESNTQHQTQDAPGNTIPLTQRVEEEEEEEEREEEEIQREGDDAEEKIEENKESDS
ncbi:uncharacterized protein LOC121504981 [Cheilinus undulatus]|uniref:uncharacterized protein LOC121504981 n=1 Tax=Cheilinus undulatus TaxID=241271 RepID=UPI001BD62384|nr:uncharacterized protein LOC121504981 [Cheilinus undulatus]